MTRPLFKPWLLAAAIALTAAGGLALPTAAQAQPVISVRIGPPPLRAEVVPGPRAGYVWAPGHYEWLHGQYIWRRGYWVAARPGYVYAAPTWVASGPNWVYRPARWERRVVHGGPPPRGDRDHDGVRNRWDRDRDGDHVRNRRDRRPGNPHRY